MLKQAQLFNVQSLSSINSDTGRKLSYFFSRERKKLNIQFAKYTMMISDHYLVSIWGGWLAQLFLNDYNDAHVIVSRYFEHVLSHKTYDFEIPI